MMRRTALAAVLAAAIGLGSTGLAVLSVQPALAQGDDIAETTEERAETVGLDHSEEYGAESGGMPQLDASTYASQILWLIITFSVLYYLLKRKALPRVADILEARQERIGNDLDKAAALRVQAADAQAEYETVVAEAQAQANTAIRATQDAVNADVTARTAALDDELAARISKAAQSVAAARQRALGELEDVAVEVAQAATARLTGVEVSLDEAKAALAAVRKEVA